MASWQIHSKVPPPDPLPEPLTPEQVVGTWQVVSHFEWSTCPAPNDTYGDYAYTWLVGTAPDGSLRVDVEGTTAYPRLTGQLQADRVLLEGVRGGDTPTPAWTFTHASGDESKLFHGVLLDLRLHEGHLSGTRDATLYRPVEPTSIDPPMSGVELVPCQVRFAVDATR